MKLTMLFLLGLVISLVAEDAEAKTWHVEKDGSGDFTVIQDAIDAAASGDTIRIGPGRYDDFVQYTFPGGDYLIIALIETHKITIIGDDSGLAVLGPATYGDPYPDPYPSAIMYWSATPGGGLDVENLRIENVRAGIYCVDTGSSVDVRNCEFIGGTRGIHTYDVLRVTDSLFDGQYGHSAISYSQADSVTYQDCVFRLNDGVGVQLQNTPYGMIRRCEFVSDAGDCVGVVVDGGGGSIIDCAFSDVVVGIGLNFPAGINIIGNRVEANFICIDSNSEGYQLLDSVLAGGAGPVLRFIARGLPHTFKGNHIIRGTGLAVEITGDYYAPAGYHIDMTENWWGATNPDSIAAWIHDANDEHNPPLDTIIDFEPFLPGPVPAEKTSLGGLKALFR